MKIKTSVNGELNRSESMFRNVIVAKFDFSLFCTRVLFSENLQL